MMIAERLEFRPSTTGRVGTVSLSTKESHAQQQPAEHRLVVTTKACILDAAADHKQKPMEQPLDSQRKPGPALPVLASAMKTSSTQKKILGRRGNVLY
eukprot:353092-Pelagomonas_calceolata.AAC.1